MKNAFFLILILFISACGQISSGLYVNTSNGRSLTLNSDGTAYESNAGIKIAEFSYSVDGKVIKINGAISPYVFLDDGSIGGVALGRYVKQ